MAKRHDSAFLQHQNDPPPDDDIEWLAWIGARLWRPYFRYSLLPNGCREPIRRLASQDLLGIEEIIANHELPCSLIAGNNGVELIVYRRPEVPQPDDLDTLARIRDSHILRGTLPHPNPRLGTIGRAHLIRIATLPQVIRACEYAGITARPSMRPPSMRPLP